MMQSEPMSRRSSRETREATTPQPTASRRQSSSRRLQRSLLWLAYTLAVVSGCIAFCYYHRPLPSNLRQALFQGVTYERQVRENPRRFILHVVTIDLKAPGIGFLVTPGDLSKPRPLKARLTSQFAREFGVQVAV